MPIYVYERPDGSRFEIRQGFNDPHLTADPETGVPVRRVLQPAPIIFKGSGWYKTDSRATSTPKAEAGRTETAETAATTTETTAEKVAEKTAETTAKVTEAAPTKPGAEAKKSADKIATAAS
jgi:predicted nucleic acid-binding Zn ribbon protein